MSSNSTEKASHCPVGWVSSIGIAISGIKMPDIALFLAWVKSKTLRAELRSEIEDFSNIIILWETLR